MNIGIIIASTRPSRNGKQVADWVKQTTDNDTDTTYTYLDLADINLPFLNEPQVPSAGNYQQESTKQWAAMIAPLDGFLVIMPEYNHSFSASIKNAVDTLYAEWNFKPFAYVGYGVIGAARSIEAFNSVLLNVDAVPITNTTTNIMLFNQLDENGKFVATEYNQVTLNNSLAKLKQWSELLKPARLA